MKDILPTLFTYVPSTDVSEAMWILNTYTDISIVDNGEDSDGYRFVVQHMKHMDEGTDPDLYLLQDIGHHKTLMDAMHDAMIYFAKEFPTKAL